MNCPSCLSSDTENLANMIEIEDMKGGAVMSGSDLLGNTNVCYDCHHKWGDGWKLTTETP